VTFEGDSRVYLELTKILHAGLVKSMEWAVYFRKYKLYSKLFLTKVSLLIILHFLVYSLLGSGRIVDSIFRTGVEISCLMPLLTLG
jgi:hypothetical protein